MSSYRSKTREELLKYCKERKLKGCHSETDRNIRNILRDSNKPLISVGGRPNELAQRHRLGHVELGMDRKKYKVVKKKSGERRWEKCKQCLIESLFQTKIRPVRPGSMWLYIINILK